MGPPAEPSALCLHDVTIPSRRRDAGMSKMCSPLVWTRPLPVPLFMGDYSSGIQICVLGFYPIFGVNCVRDV